MVNVELLQKTLAHIEANTADWEQEIWMCGSSGCFAGWAVALDRGRTIADLTDSKGSGWEPICTIDGEDISTLARDALQLDPGMSVELFCSNNTLDDLRQFVERLTAGWIVDWSDELQDSVWIRDDEVEEMDLERR